MRERGLIWLLAIAWLVGSPSVARAASENPFTFGDSAFCASNHPVDDFGISRLPRVPVVPETGAALGHPALLIYGGSPRVTSTPQGFGYEFRKADFTGPPVRLDWTVTAELWTVDRAGHEIREVDRGEVRIGALDGTDRPRLELDPPKRRRGFYRYDLQFTNARGREVGLYGSYFKVVRPYWDVRLGLSRRIVHPGGRILSRVENFGSETVSYGEYFAVQHFARHRWRATRGLTPDIWLAWSGAVEAGGSGRCSALTIPRHLRPGRYRIVKAVGQAAGPDRPGRARRPTAVFRVLP